MKTKQRVRNFNLLTVKEWRSVILSLIRESEEMEASAALLRPARFVRRLPDMGIRDIVGDSLHDDDTGLIRATVAHLQINLRPRGRKRFCEALTRLAQKTHRYLAGNPQDMNNLLEGLASFASLLPGSVDADVSEKIVFGSARIPVRVKFAYGLIHRDFPCAVMECFWLRLASIARERPEFFPVLFSYYATQHAWTHAVSMLPKVRQATEEPEVFSLQLSTALREVMNETYLPPDWEGILRRSFRDVEVWMRKFLMKEVIPFSRNGDRLLAALSRTEGKMKDEEEK